MEHRIARLVPPGLRQVRCLGRAKVGFQAALIAMVANLTLAGAALAASRLSRALHSTAPHLRQTLHHPIAAFHDWIVAIAPMPVGTRDRSEMAASRPGL